MAHKVPQDEYLNSKKIMVKEELKRHYEFRRHIRVYRKETQTNKLPTSKKHSLAQEILKTPTLIQEIAKSAHIFMYLLLFEYKFSLKTADYLQSHGGNECVTYVSRFRDTFSPQLQSCPEIKGII